MVGGSLVFKFSEAPVNYRAFVVVAAVSLLGAVGCSSAPTTKPAAPAATATPAPADASAKAATAEAKTDALKCKRDSDERSIEIEAVEKTSCKVWYSKFGQRANIASSAKGTSHCHDVRNKIKSNLEGAGFKCQ